jgi:DNA-binding SARP family transcriptional activator
MLEFRALGRLDLRDPDTGRPIHAVLAQPKRVALLARLALARPRGWQQRTTLLGLFWPEVPEERARHALRQALYLLRQSLGEGVIVGRGEAEVGVDPPAMRCDVWSFESALARGDPAGALELYADDLLPGFSIGGCPLFEEWLARRREELRRQAVGAALAVTGEDALEGLRRAAGWAPFDDAVLRRLMEELAVRGETAAALDAYASHAARVQRELGAEPSEAAVALAVRLRDRAAASSAPLRRSAPAAGHVGDPGAGPGAAGEAAGARRVPASGPTSG